jgi:hypothetical protein
MRTFQAGAGLKALRFKFNMAVAMLAGTFDIHVFPLVGFVLDYPPAARRCPAAYPAPQARAHVAKSALRRGRNSATIHECENRTSGLAAPRLKSDTFRPNEICS